MATLFFFGQDRKKIRDLGQGELYIISDFWYFFLSDDDCDEEDRSTITAACRAYRLKKPIHPYSNNRASELYQVTVKLSNGGALLFVYQPRFDNSNSEYAREIELIDLFYKVTIPNFLNMYSKIYFTPFATQGTTNSAVKQKMFTRLFDFANSIVENNLNVQLHMYSFYKVYDNDNNTRMITNWKSLQQEFRIHSFNSHYGPSRVVEMCFDGKLGLCVRCTQKQGSYGCFFDAKQAQQIIQMLTHNMDDLKLTIHEPSNFENPSSTYDDFDQGRICIGDDCSLKVLKNADSYIKIDDSIAEELIGMQHAYKAFSDEIERYTTYSLSCLKIFVVEPKDDDASSSLQLQVRSNRPPPYGGNKTAPKKLALIPLKYCRDLFDIIQEGKFRVELNVYDDEHANIFEIFLMKLMKGLRKMHDAGVCHRDIKAENISICDGDVKFLDFGFATGLDEVYRAGTFTHESVLRADNRYENDIYDGLASKLFRYDVNKSLIRKALENAMEKNGLEILQPIMQDLYACVITMRFVMTEFHETNNIPEFGFLEAYNHDHDLASLVVKTYADPMNENLGRKQYQYNDRIDYGGGNVDQEKVNQYNLEVWNSAKSLRSLIHDDMTAAATVAHDDKDPEFLSSLDEYISHLESRCTTFKSFLKDIHEPQQQVGGGGARDGMMLQKPFRRIKQVISFHVDMLKKIMEELDCDDGGRF
jgi:serine/threonine protein kinase